jgi:NADH-quinone oxidoreductase subunit M
MDVQLPWLSMLLWLPFAVALLVLLVPSEQRALLRGLALAGSLLVAALGFVLLFGFQADYRAYQYSESVAWIPQFGIRYHIGMDGISLWLVVLTVLLTPIMILSSFKAIEKRPKEYYISLLVLETAVIGALVSLDVFLFYVFWEVMLVPMFLLIGIWGGERRIYATIKFLLFTMVGSLLMLVGILYVYFHTNTVTLDQQYSFALNDFLQVHLDKSEQLWLYGAFFVAFAIKVPLFPLHTWLPDAHTEAPTAGSVILAAVLLKLGTYGLVRFAMPLFPYAAIETAPLVGVLAVIGIIYASLVALVQRDVKRLIAYSSVAHLGFVVLGLVAFTPQGFEGGVFQMIAHGVSTGGLFLCIGIIYERRHTRQIKDFGGLAKQLPVFATFFMIILLSSAALPGTNGFVGEFLVLLGTFNSGTLSGAWGRTLTVFAASGMVLGAVYLLWMYQRVMFGPIVHEENKQLKDLKVREVIYLLPIIALIFIMGVFPNVVLDHIRPSAHEFFRVFNARLAHTLDQAPAPTLSQPGAIIEVWETGQVPNQQKVGETGQAPNQQKMPVGLPVQGEPDARLAPPQPRPDAEPTPDEALPERNPRDAYAARMLAVLSQMSAVDSAAQGLATPERRTAALGLSLSPREGVEP